MIATWSPLPRGLRARVFAGVGVLHLLAILALIRAFAPDFTAPQVQRPMPAIAIALPSPPVPSSAPQPEERPRSATSAAARPAGRAAPRAVPREASAPRPQVTLTPPQDMPVVAGTAGANAAGAGISGVGTGAGSAGTGTGGGGGGGAGQGSGGVATKPVKIVGDINSARDYPPQSRDLRLGDHVVIWLTVGTDGRPAACRIARPSRDPEADAVTCRLAMARFRFQPARDAAGQPIVSVYGWRQRWFSGG